ncbi:MAG: DUF3868 domain-containing protein [Muribaculaceae bacterium]|nr:DUF3868 domain-containing protein [Muribaculaceae bacterium]
MITRYTRTIIRTAILAAATIFGNISADGAKQAASGLQSVKVKDVTLAKQHGKMTVKMQLDLSDVKIGSNQQIIYTPMLSSETDSVTLSPIVLNGRNTAIKELRDSKRKVSGARTTLTKKSNQPAVVEVSDELPYQQWMDLCHLSLAEDLCGCGRLQDQAKLPIMEFDNRPPSAPLMTYVAPKAEAVKARAEKGSAFVDYVVNKTNILPDYRGNRKEIAKIVATIDLVRKDPNVSITEINIHGYASPEGKYENNARLADGRAASLREYVKSLYTLPDHIFTSAATPEDWAGLRRLTEASQLPERDAILAIIDNNSLSPDAKDQAIRQQFPKTYAYILKEWYPGLRHSDYTVSYVVRPFTVEETKEIMKRNPRQVSLNEMFLVAQTLEPGSDEFNDVMSIAVETYPDDATANLNAGYAALSRNQLSKAETYLAKAGTGPDADHARGVLAMKQDKFGEARQLLERAAQAGVANANKNLDILNRLEQLYKQNLPE